MFGCRMCANTPFGAIFGYTDEDYDRSDTTRARNKKKKEITSRLSQADTDEGELGIRRATSEEKSRFRPRSPEEVLVKVKAWESYLHTRAHDFWGDSSAIQEILMKVAQSVDKQADPILGEMSECIFWHGDFDDENDCPIIRMIKPGESQESQTFVTRILVFLYADDGSFTELQTVSGFVHSHLIRQLIVIPRSAFNNLLDPTSKIQ